MPRGRGRCVVDVALGRFRGRGGDVHRQARGPRGRPGVLTTVRSLAGGGQHLARSGCAVVHYPISAGREVRARRGVRRTGRVGRLDAACEPEWIEERRARSQRRCGSCCQRRPRGEPGRFSRCRAGRSSRTAAWRCSATPRIRCCRFWRRVACWRSRMLWCWPIASARTGSGEVTERLETYNRLQAPAGAQRGARLALQRPHLSSERLGCGAAQSRICHAAGGAR